MNDKSLLLIKVSGKDQPGITSEMMQILTQYPVEVLDMSQAVVQKLLSLSLLFKFTSLNPAPLSNGELDEIESKLLRKADELSLKIEIEKIQPEPLPPHRLKHYALTLLADPVSTHALHEVTKIIADLGVNIDFIKKLSENSFSCVEMGVSSYQSLNTQTLKKDLLFISKTYNVDIGLQEEGLYRRAKRLVVLDIDSTLIQSEVIDELARENGVYEKVSAITHQAMMGQMNFRESLRLRCQTLKGLNTSDLEKVYNRLQLTPGAETLIHVLKKLGYKIAVISGGFTFVAEKLKQKLGLDYAYANTLDTRGGVLTGEVLPPILDAQRKADLLEVIAQQEKIKLDQVIAIGDGANDVLMLEKAGLGVAFNAKPMVREKADLAISQKNMKSILYLLGISEREVSEALQSA